MEHFLGGPSVFGNPNLNADDLYLQVTRVEVSYPRALGTWGANKEGKKGGKHAS